MKSQSRPSRRSMRAMETMIREGAIVRENSCDRKRSYSVGEVVTARRQMRRKGKRCRIYHCRFCGRYHLTSTA